jgi:hypothetical protein
VDGPEQIDVWPVWGRVVFWIVFAAILIAAAILGFHGHNQGTAIRIAVSVVVVPALVVIVVTLLKRPNR